MGGNPLGQNDNKFQNHNPNIATVLSIIFAGLGQLYNRRFLKGFIFILLEIATLITFLDSINYGIWGLRTLGTIPGTDHSIRLLVFGVLAIICTAILIKLNIFNVIDVRKNANYIKEDWTSKDIQVATTSFYVTAHP